VAKSSPDLAGADRSPTESTRRLGASVANVWTAHTAAGKACRQRPSEEQHAPAAPTDEDGGSGVLPARAKLDPETQRWHTDHSQDIIKGG
jgi:hypothetical protein